MIQHGGLSSSFPNISWVSGRGPSFQEETSDLFCRYGIPEPQGTGEGPAGPSQPGPGRKRLLDSQLALLDHFSHLNSIYYLYIYIYVCTYIYIYLGGYGPLNNEPRIFPCQFCFGGRYCWSMFWVGLFCKCQPRIHKPPVYEGGLPCFGGKTPNQKSGSISPGLTLMRIIWHESACLKFERNPRNFCISCNVLLLLSAIHGKSILATV